MGDGRGKGRNFRVFEGLKAGEIREMTKQCLIFRNRKRAQGRKQTAGAGAGAENAWYKWPEVWTVCHPLPPLVKKRASLIAVFVIYVYLSSLIFSLAFHEIENRILMKSSQDGGDKSRHRSHDQTLVSRNCSYPPQVSVSFTFKFALLKFKIQFKNACD